MNAHRATTAIDAGMLVAGTAALAAVVMLTLSLATDVGNLLTRNTVRLALAWYVAALCLMLSLGLADWTAGTPRGRLARWCWTWGLACLLCHLPIAFHYFDHWSHARALERTRQVSGVGEGIYVSYLLVVLWTADVGYWWLRPVTYADRAAWIGRGLHTFMLFVIFNSTIVYESGPIRWIGALGFAALAVAWFASRRRRKSNAFSAHPACAP